MSAPTAFAHDLYEGFPASVAGFTELVVLLREALAQRDKTIKEKNLALYQKQGVIDSLNSQLNRINRVVTDYVPEHNYDDR